MRRWVFFRRAYRTLVDGLFYGYPLCCVVRFSWDALWGVMSCGRGQHFPPGDAPLWAIDPRSPSGFTECGNGKSFMACEWFHFGNRALTDRGRRRKTYIWDYRVVGR